MVKLRFFTLFVLIILLGAVTLHCDAKPGGGKKGGGPRQPPKTKPPPTKPPTTKQPLPTTTRKTTIPTKTPTTTKFTTTTRRTTRKPITICPKKNPKCNEDRTVTNFPQTTETNFPQTTAAYLQSFYIYAINPGYEKPIEAVMDRLAHHQIISYRMDLEVPGAVVIAITAEAQRALENVAQFYSWAISPLMTPY